MDILSAMRTFVAIVDAGSLTAAADRLDRSQPTVVRSLAALENHLDARLLQRTTRRMSLTTEGNQYLERCRQIIADVDEAAALVAAEHAELAGFLRVTAPVMFGQMHVAPLLSAFLDDHPRVTADLLLLDRNVDLVDEGIDLAIRIGPLPDSGLVGIPAGNVRRVVCASPRLLAQTGEPSSPQQLIDLPCVRLQVYARSGTWRFRDGADNVAVKVDGRFSCNQVAAAVDACVGGTGFGQFLSYQVQITSPPAAWCACCGRMRVWRFRSLSFIRRLVLRRHASGRSPGTSAADCGRVILPREPNGTADCQARSRRVVPGRTVPCER